MKRNKILIAAIVIVLLAGLMLGAYALFAPRGAEGAKKITISVEGAGEANGTFALQTNQAYLRGALEDKGLIAGEESAYGLFVKSVNGRTADDAKQEWWCITKDGDMLMTGVDTTPIADGERYELTLTTGY